MFGAEMVVAVGPPSSLACELADACMTLVGFTNDAGATLHTCPESSARLIVLCMFEDDFLPDMVALERALTYLAAETIPLST